MFGGDDIGKLSLEEYMEYVKTQYTSKIKKESIDREQKEKIKRMITGWKMNLDITKIIHIT